MATSNSLTAAALVAQIVDQQTTRSVLAPLQIISESARKASLNRDAIVALLRRVTDLVEVLRAGVQEPSVRADNAWNDALNQFASLLDEVLPTLREITGSNSLHHLLYQERNAARIEALSSRCQNLYSALMVRARIDAELVAGANVERAEQSNLADVIRLPEASLPSHPSQQVDSPELRWSPSIPPRPLVLFGRSPEASALVYAFVDNDPAYVAILGGPDMGKTALSLAVLHHEAVVAKFSACRYFVPFDAISSPRECITITAHAIGVFDLDEKQLVKRIAALVETPANLLQRWEDEQTAMLARSKDSKHRLDSLDASVVLSIQSPRMAASPPSLTLLRILALLPDGVVESDIPCMAPDMPGSSLSALLQNALAFRSMPGDRVQLLAPIRSSVLVHYPPSSAQLHDLAKFYFELADLLTRVGQTPTPVDIIAAIAREVANIGTTHIAALGAAANLVRLFLLAGIGNVDFLPRALSAARAAGYDDLTAELLCLTANAVPSKCSGVGVSYGDPYACLLEARRIYERLVDMDGVMRTTLTLTPFMPVHEHMGICLQMLELPKTQQNINMVARSYRALATVCSSRGRLLNARNYLASALKILREREASERRELQDVVDIGVCLLSLANYESPSGSGVLQCAAINILARAAQQERRLEAAQHGFVLCALVGIHLEFGKRSSEVADIVVLGWRQGGCTGKGVLKGSYRFKLLWINGVDEDICDGGPKGVILRNANGAPSGSSRCSCQSATPSTCLGGHDQVTRLWAEDKRI
ncbi:hypothetical protein AURDEDRAFT_124249 [Auricularia subglabra TFB-10046 SS5]|nr:hypothetical protein AURDEDRAFT_124249 [Auricularia subglabra TFB-10046 SS5]